MNKHSKKYKANRKKLEMWIKRKALIKFAKSCGISVSMKHKGWIRRMCLSVAEELCVNITGDQNAMINKLYEYILKGTGRRLPDHTPPWADRSAIRVVYKKCRETTEKTGVLHHVDHIIPIKGKIVSGLHVAENLQIITAEENIRKSNKWN